MHFSVSIAGAGNMAWNLAHALQKQGHHVRQIIGRNAEQAEKLATSLGIKWDHLHPKALDPLSEILILCVKDEALAEVAALLATPNIILVHTSGSIPLQVLLPYAKHCGVLYPLQTLTKDSLKDFSQVPLCIEASDENTKEKLTNLAQTISSKVTTVSSEQRLFLHLAAVFANNFSNHLYTISKSILDQQGLSFDLLKPLILETAAKASTHNPADIQTGPARRNDRTVMQKHLALLHDKPAQRELYKLFSELIRDSSS